MHAALVKLTIDPDQAPAAADALTHDILPTVRSAPGFVAGYWLEPVDGHGFLVRRSLRRYVSVVDEYDLTATQKSSASC